MVNFIALADKAKTKVDQNGRDVTLVRLSRTVTDALKPWRASADTRTTPDASLTVKAVFVEPSSAVRLGLTSTDSQLVKRSTQIMIVALGSLVTDDLTTFDEVIDSSDNWRITGVEKLRPADTTLLYFIGVAR